VKKNRKYMVDAGMEKVYPVSEKVYLASFSEPRFTFVANQTNLYPNINHIFDLSCFDHVFR
jgi:hypothetical protein